MAEVLLWLRENPGAWRIVVAFIVIEWLLDIVGDLVTDWIRGLIQSWRQRGQ